MKPSAFDWADPFRIDDQLTAEEQMIRDAAGSYAQEKLLPRVIDAYREEKTEPEIFREMGEMGLLGVTIPEAYGGVGANYVSYGLVAREIERIDSGYRSMMSVQSSLVMYPIHAFGSEEQRQKFRHDLDLRLATHLCRWIAAGLRGQRRAGENQNSQCSEDVSHLKSS
ncbi:MAG: acyl-CoA dehydrogenase family protein, partial [Pseudomonadota bacterium]